MCEYCGCLSLRAIEELTDEHDELLTLVRDASAAIADGDAGRAGAVVAAMLRVLGPHTAVEEEALFPAMAVEHADHVAALHEEHQRVEAALAAGTAGSADWGASLLAGLDLLREHIKKEQDGLFPAALTTLSSDQWEALERVRARVGSPLAEAAQS